MSIILDIIPALSKLLDKIIPDPTAREQAAFQDILKCIDFLKERKAAGVPLDPARLNREKGCGYAVELGMK